MSPSTAVWCYRCGTEVTVPVQPRSVEVSSNGLMLVVTFERQEVKHACPPPSRSHPGLVRLPVPAPPQDRP